MTNEDIERIIAPMRDMGFPEDEIKMIQDALERDIPKPIIKRGTQHLCPHCLKKGQRTIIFPTEDYCSRCGQKVNFTSESQKDDSFEALVECYNYGKTEALAEAIREVERYGSVWMAYRDNMDVHQVAECALHATKESVKNILQRLHDKYKNELHM